MNRKRYITFFVIVGLTLNMNLTLARNVAGYITTNSSDTLFGEIKISRFNIFTGGIVWNGIDLESFHSTVEFRINREWDYKSFTPNDITGFGFTDKSINYEFKTFVIKSKSLIQPEREKFRFLNLVYRGDVNVYRDIVRERNYFKSEMLDQKLIDYYSYYLFDSEHGLQESVMSGNNKSVLDLLIFYELDSNFIAQLLVNNRFKNIIEILQEYDRWKMTHATIIKNT